MQDDLENINEEPCCNEKAMKHTNIKVAARREVESCRRIERAKTRSGKSRMEQPMADGGARLFCWPPPTRRDAKLK